MPNLLLQRVQVKVAGAAGLSEGVSAMEAVRHSGIRSKTSPCRTDNEVVPAADRIFLKRSFRIIGAGRTQNGWGMKSRVPVERTPLGQTA